MVSLAKKVMPLSLIIALRFFGLFIVLSVLSQYALGLKHSSALLAGVAVGGYALTQAVLQTPFGLLSDKIGRKKTILIGLLTFIAGSIVCAISNDIYWLLFGRFLQGAGAIGSVITAMIADVASEEERAHAMAIMGMVIAMTFAVAMIAGPLFAGFLGVPSLFWLTAILAATALLILFSSVPEPPRIVHTYSQEKVRIKHVFQDKDLVRMYITFLFHSSTMTIAFFIIPILLKNKFHIDPTGFWKVYLPAVIFGVIAMGPAAVFGEKYSKGKEIFLLSIFFIVVSFFLMGFTSSFLLFGIGATFFFIGFNMFEPLLQSFVAKFAKVHQKGTALGVANTFAYIGVFLGGVFGGFMYQHFQERGVAIFVFIVAIFWTWWILGMKNPGHRQTAYIELNDQARAKLHDIKKVDGITDQYINETEAVIVIKYDAHITNEDFIKKFFE